MSNACEIHPQELVVVLTGQVASYQEVTTASDKARRVTSLCLQFSVFIECLEAWGLWDPRQKKALHGCKPMLAVDLCVSS